MHNGPPFWVPSLNLWCSLPNSGSSEHQAKAEAGRSQPKAAGSVDIIGLMGTLSLAIRFYALATGMGWDASDAKGGAGEAGNSRCVRPARVVVFFQRKGILVWLAG